MANSVLGIFQGSKSDCLAWFESTEPIRGIAKPGIDMGDGFETPSSCFGKIPEDIY